MANETLETQESLRWEYREVATAHRFYVGLRFIIAAFTATLHSALLTFYNKGVEVLDSGKEVRTVPIGNFDIPLQAHPIAITFMGIITMMAIFFMERRNIDRFSNMMSRGKEIEFSMGLTNGQFSRLSETGGYNLFTYTWSLNIIYCVLGVMWAVLLVLQCKSL